MKTGLLALVVAYILSQFFRAFLAVLTPALDADIGAGADDLAFASGLWFLFFAAMQLPVGWALDCIGPRLTSAVLLALGGGGGAALFAIATQPAHVSAAMGLIGIGCSPVLMASYYIFARIYPARVFATLAALVIGVGSIGNIAGSAPMAWAVGIFGWRETMAGLAVITVTVAAILYVTVQDPPLDTSAKRGSVLDLLRMPALWFILPLMFVNYAPAAGIRGLWIGPYLADVFGADAAGIGRSSLIMGLAMITANFVYGPLDRIFGTRKWVVFSGQAIGILCLLTLALFPTSGFWKVTLLAAGVGFFGSAFPVIVAHARAFFPAHLIGRGVTLVNLFGIGGAGVFQFVTGRLHTAVGDATAQPAAPYSAIFLLFGLSLAVGAAFYLFSEDRTD